MTAVAKNQMCGKKVSFHTKAKAEAVALRFNQRVYECPICFCWHCTASEDWKTEYVERHIMDKALAKQESEIRGELNQKHKDLRQKNHALECEVYKLKRINEVLTKCRCKCDAPTPDTGESA